jgi:hypothetical protein
VDRVAHEGEIIPEDFRRWGDALGPASAARRAVRTGIEMSPARSRRLASGIPFALAAGPIAAKNASGSSASIATIAATTAGPDRT